MPPKSNKTPKNKTIKKSKVVTEDDNSVDSDISDYGMSGGSDEEVEKEEAAEVENYDEIDEDDALGDEGNEVDDEDNPNDEVDEADEADEVDDADDAEETKSVSDDEEVAEDMGDECMYRFSKKKKDIEDDEDDIDVDDFFDEDDQVNDPNNMIVPNEKRITKPVLSKYERVRLIGERARQISLGAKRMIKNSTHMDPKDVARLELEMKVIPLIVIRTLPTGKIEKWKPSELEIVN